MFRNSLNTLAVFIIVLTQIILQSSINSCKAMNDEIEQLNNLMKNHHISTPEKERQPLKTPNSDPRTRKYTFDINLLRHVNETKTGIYFSKTARLNCSGVTISEPEDGTIFGENAPLYQMDNFLFKQVETDGTSGWGRNHLAASLFVIVNDATKGEKRCIQGNILAQQRENNLGYEFSTSPANKNMKNRKLANFVSSELNPTLLAYVSENNYLPIVQSNLRPIFDKTSNHGDRLALDTISTNVDLFFKLIRKSAHRADLCIQGMGIKYYSSYDACDLCFQKIYSTKDEIKEKINTFAKHGGYKTEENQEIPLYSLFYSTRPYKDAKYSISWIDPRDQQGFQYTNGTIDYEFPKRRGIVKYPTYHYKLPTFSSPHKELFAERDSRQLNLLRENMELNNNMIYSYVSRLEPDGLLICYK